MKRHLMTRGTEGFSGVEVPGLRKIMVSDAPLLGKLMLEAYQGTIDYDGETLEQSIQEMEGTLNGKYGAVIWEASFVVKGSAGAQSAIVFVDYQKEKMPLLAFTMTHPDDKGKGLAKKLISHSLKALSDLGMSECCLVVTEGNQPAQSIYEKLGFQYRT